MFKLIRLTVFFQALGYLLQFGALFLFAKILGAEKQGILTIFRASGQIIASLLMFGLPAGIVYFVGKHRELFIPVLTNCVKLFLIVFSLLVLFLFILPIEKLPKVFSTDKYIPYLLAFVFFLSLSNIFQLSILSLKKYLYYNLFAFGAGLIIFVFSILIWVSPEVNSKLNFAITAYIVTYGILFIYGAILIFNQTRKIRNKEAKQSFSGQIKVGLRGFISGIAALLLFRLDLFLVEYYLSFKEVGIYSIALFGSEMVTRIPGWSAAIISPMVASNEGGHVRRTVFLFYSAMIIALFLGSLFIMGIIIFPGFISDLAGKDFAGVETCMLLLLPRVIMQSGVGILGCEFGRQGVPLVSSGRMYCSAYFSCYYLDMILIPRFGVNGAALGNSLAYISAAVIFWVGFRKYNEVTEDVRLKTYWCTIQGYIHEHLPGH